jgi:hypothetical protein
VTAAGYSISKPMIKRRNKNQNEFTGDNEKEFTGL